MNFDGRDNTLESHNVIKEYHFYIINDCEHDILFIQHYFHLIY